VTAIRTLVFAEPETPILGALWLPADDAAALLGCRLGAEQLVVSGRLKIGGEDEPWQVEGEGVSLLCSPAGPAARCGPVDGDWDSTDQLCEVSGTVAVGGASHEISCMGWRENIEGRFELTEIDSFRQTYGWFERAEGISLLAYRPQKSRGQDADVVAGAVLEAQPTPRVADPRLSTTYDASGAPSRVGLELWFEPETPEEESDDGDGQHFARRAAAEATGERIEWAVADFRLQAALLRWHSRGSDGTGVYLLGQRA
jgi:hypothetical protein